ncbi:MAG: FxLYD domain-containing protein [Chloroflexaceae bacterium]|nr:FxLYD domain-containing protein [Chloroflexaceae bacterium]
MLGLLAFSNVSAQIDCTAFSCIYLPFVTKAEDVPLEPAPSPTVAPTPAPSTVFVRSQRDFFVGNSLYIVGEVVNGTSSPVYFVKITARFFNASNQLIAVEDTFAYLTKTEPNQRNPFKMILSNAPRDISRTELTLEWLSTSILEYQAVTVLNQATRDNFGVEVFGEVRNDQSFQFSNVEVVVTFYDAGGGVIDTDFGFASSTILAPGATSIYSIKTFERELNFASYVVQAQGYRTP